MASLENIRSSVKKQWGKALGKAEKTADLTSTKIKIKGIDIKLAEKYEELGRLTYDNIHGNADTKEIDRVIAEIDELIARKDSLCDDILQKKNK